MKNSDLVKWLKVIYIKNSGKAVLSYFFMSIVSYFLAFLGTSEVVDAVAGPDSGSAVVLIVRMVAIIVVTLLLIVMLQFGYYSMIFQMARNKEGKFSYIFTGFKNFSKTWFICLWYVILFGAILWGAVSAGSWIYDNYGEAWFNISKLVEDEKQIILQAQEAAVKVGQTLPPVIMTVAERILSALILLIFIFTSFILLLPSIFTFCFRLDNGSKPSLYAFAASYRLSFKDWNIFRFIGLAFMGCWKNLLIALIAYMVEVAVVLFGGKSAIGTMIVQFICVINLYNAIAKIYISIPVFYNQKTGIYKYKKIDNPMTVAMQDENTDEDSSDGE